VRSCEESREGLRYGSITGIKNGKKYFHASYQMQGKWPMSLLMAPF
jgi:hypothetical protein